MPPNSIIPDDSRHASSNSSVIVLVLIFVILVGASVYMYKSGIFGTKMPATEETKAPVYSQDKVVVTGTDLKSAGPARDKLPAIFAKDFPLPANAVITESVTTDYPERKVTLSTFGYTTSLSPKEAYALYESYLTKNGYVSTKESKKVDQYIMGTKNNDDLSVIVGLNGKSTMVNISFLDRK